VFVCVDVSERECVRGEALTGISASPVSSGGAWDTLLWLLDGSVRGHDEDQRPALDRPDKYGPIPAES